MPQQKPPQPFDGSRLIAEASFELDQSVVDEVVADVSFCFFFSCGGKVESGSGDVELAGARPLADAFDDVAVTIAGGKLHPGIDAGGIRPQQRLDKTDFFEEVVPVERREQTHAGDDVADRYLCGCL